MQSSFTLVNPTPYFVSYEKYFTTRTDFVWPLVICPSWQDPKKRGCSEMADPRHAKLAHCFRWSWSAHCQSSRHNVMVKTRPAAAEMGNTPTRWHNKSNSCLWALTQSSSWLNRPLVQLLASSEMLLPASSNTVRHCKSTLLLLKIIDQILMPMHWTVCPAEVDHFFR